MNASNHSTSIDLTVWKSFQRKSSIPNKRAAVVEGWGDGGIFGRDKRCGETFATAGKKKGVADFSEGVGVVNVDGGTGGIRSKVEGENGNES